jgi:hypothetical protein
MGIDVPSMALLSAAKCVGVDFTLTAMIGRQNFAGACVEAGLNRMFETLGISQDSHEFRARSPFCEELFGLLGAKQVESFDVSDYQQATHIHDMNEPIPADFRERYSCVHDGGTIEHVFNIPQALKNCLQMVRLGGHFTQVNIANNYMGHGFWQFSPEMIYRTMSPENGFEIRAVLLHETIPGGSWYLVADPEKVGERVQLCNSHPTYILTIARRIAIKDIFAKPPQQSDYVVQWSSTAPAATPRQPGKRSPIRRLLGRIKRSAASVLKRSPPVYDPRHYRPLDEEQVWRGDL